MILLDTHIVWWLAYEPDKLPDSAAEAILSQSHLTQGLAISAATMYELAWLLEKGRLQISTSSSAFLHQTASRFAVLPVSGTVAIEAARLPVPFHGDPMDRLIVATARTLDLTLVTADRDILSASLCKLIR